MLSQKLKTVGLVSALACLALLPMGCKKAPPITLSCNASAPTVYPGDPLSVTATVGSVDTTKNTNVIYSWSGEGVTGNGTSASVNTAPLAPGSYTVKADVKEGKKGKEGLKPGQSAECSSDYAVKAFDPPTISCSASPSTIKPGDSATITAVGVSPQSRPLSYSYTASAGTVTGSGTTAEYSSAGAPTGTVGITCNVSDDKGHSVNSSTSLTITAPYVPPPPKTQAKQTCRGWIREKPGGWRGRPERGRRASWWLARRDSANSCGNWRYWPVEDCHRQAKYCQTPQRFRLNASSMTTRQA